jgi:hypothetical protein
MAIRRAKVIKVATVAVIAALLLLELVARLFGAPESIPDRTFTEAPEWRYPAHIAKDAELFWRYRPDRVVREGFFAPGRYTINSDGFRSPEIASETDPNTQRVVCLGGSTTFGLGVADGECYPRRLEYYLNELDPKRRHWQVINAGVTNYSTHQGVALARRWIPRWNPDIVVCSYTWGDRQPAADGIADDQLTLPPAWRLALENALIRLAAVQWAKRILVGAAAPAEEKPGSYPVIRRVSTPDFNANIEKLVRSAHAVGARAIWATAPISWPPQGLTDTSGVFLYHHEYRDVAEYATLAARGEVAQLANAFNLFPEFYDDRTRDIKHFNSAGHDFAGEFLARHILGLEQVRVQAQLRLLREGQ